jgi:hypothetical protein
MPSGSVYSLRKLLVIEPPPIGVFENEVSLIQVGTDGIE